MGVMGQGADFSAVCDVIDGLVNLFTSAALDAAAGLPPAGDGTPAVVEVIDTMTRAAQTPDHYVIVAYQQPVAAVGGLAVEGSVDFSDVGNRQLAENFRVWCEASSWTGDTDPAAPRRTRRNVLGIYSAMMRALMADPTIQGAVPGPAAVVRPGLLRWLSDAGEDGTVATVQFSVDVIGEVWVPL